MYNQLFALTCTVFVMIIGFPVIVWLMWLLNVHIARWSVTFLNANLLRTSEETAVLVLCVAFAVFLSCEAIAFQLTLANVIMMLSLIRCCLASHDWYEIIS